MSVAFATLREALVKRPAGQTVLSGHGVEWTAGAMLDEVILQLNTRAAKAGIPL